MATLPVWPGRGRQFPLGTSACSRPPIGTGDRPAWLLWWVACIVPKGRIDVYRTGLDLAYR